MKRINARWPQISREELLRGLRTVIPVTLGTLAFSYTVNTMTMLATSFENSTQNYILGTIFPLILTPVTVFPLVIMMERLREMKRDLEALLRIDPLTELPNRRAFFEAARAIFSQHSTATVMMIDIDHFKTVNDRLGHDTGDAVLRSVAQVIHKLVAGEAVQGRKFAARIGGEEFAVVVEEMGSQQAGRLAERIVDAVRCAPIVYRGITVPATVSVGVAQRLQGNSVDQSLRAADLACYRAKRLGRDQWCDSEALANRKPVDPEHSDGAVRLQLRAL
jgi:diguanylate cyclase (GGDEF)-like protein